MEAALVTQSTIITVPEEIVQVRSLLRNGSKRKGDSMSRVTQYYCELCGEEAWGERVHLVCMEREQAWADMADGILSPSEWWRTGESNPSPARS